MREPSYFGQNFDANQVVVAPAPGETYADNVRAYYRAVGRLDFGVREPGTAADVAAAIELAWRRLGVLVDGPVCVPPVRVYAKRAGGLLEVVFTNAADPDREPDLLRRGLRVTFRRTVESGQVVAAVLELTAPNSTSYGADVKSGFAWERGVAYAYGGDGARQPLSADVAAQLLAIVRKA